MQIRRKSRPRLELSDNTKAELTGLLLLDASSERAERVLREVEELLGIFVNVQQRPHGVRRRGAPANTALMEAIRRLRLIFRRHYRDRRLGRHTRGWVKFLGPEEEQELQFVQTALRSINDQSFRGLQQLRNTQYLKRLFRDSRCMPPLLAPDRVERIAKARNLQQKPALVLAEKISLGKLADGFTAREVRRKGWRDLPDELVQSALDRMVAEGWLEAVRRPDDSRGKPTDKYKILRTTAEPWEFDSSDGTDEN